MKTKHELSLRFIKLINVVIITIPFALCWYLYYADKIMTPFFRKGNWLIILIFSLLYIFFARIYDSFVINLTRITDLVYSQTLAFLITDGMMYIIIILLARRIPNVLPGIYAIVSQILLSSLWAIIAHRWFFRVFPPQKTLIIFHEKENITALIKEYGIDKRFNVVNSVEDDKCIADLSVLNNIQTAFITNVQSHERNIILKYCIEKSICVYTLPRVGDLLMRSARDIHMFHLPVLMISRYCPTPEFHFIKRFFDIIISFTVLVILSPILLLTALAIKITDNGPVFYKQKRLTLNGKVFNVLKFRSMRVDAEKDGVARLSTGTKDNRITPIGRFIRKVRLDELPQLFNILGGSMSIVGPRPERPEIAKQYEKELPEFALRLQAKAGLTGYAQIYGKYNTTPYDKLEMDLLYISNPSLLQDLKIIFATIKIIFLPESTEGVAEGQTTASNSDD